ncbi:unnamed protein product [Cunninghamella blakesleeana]
MHLGYAKIPVPDIRTQNNKTPLVAAPTKSPPPVLMPRPRPAVHPTLQLTKAYSQFVIPSPSSTTTTDHE